MSIVTLSTNSNLTRATATVEANRLAVPLTTAWTFPASCSNTITAIATCSPPLFTGVYENSGYYSPGACYAGYEIGCIATVQTVNDEPVKSSETVAFCVPR